MKELYVVATSEAGPLTHQQLAQAWEGGEVEYLAGVRPGSFTIKTAELEVKVEHSQKKVDLKLDDETFGGSTQSLAALKKAKGFYRIFVEPGKPQPSIAVFEALWCARTLMEHTEAVLVDVTAFMLHDLEDLAEITELEFDIRDHINLHAVEVTQGATPLWVHSHGMEKVGLRDVEAFHLAEDDLMPAETFLHELCTDMAFGHGPPARALVDTSEGHSFMIVPSEEGRLNLMGVPLDAFEGHEGLFFTVVSPDGRHTLSELLKPYRERFQRESPEEAETLRTTAQELLPAFKSRFLRRGWMEPFTFLVRASFESHPGPDPVSEDLWVEVLKWEEQALVGRLIDGGAHTTEWRKGAQVELTEQQLNAIAVGREGRTLEEKEMKELLLAERPI